MFFFMHKKIHYPYLTLLIISQGESLPLAMGVYLMGPFKHGTIVQLELNRFASPEAEISVKNIGQEGGGSLCGYRGDNCGYTITE